MNTKNFKLQKGEKIYVQWGEWTSNSIGHQFEI